MRCGRAPPRSSSVTPPTTAPRWARWSAIRLSESICAGIETATAQGATLLAGGRPYTGAPIVRRILHRTDHRRTGLPTRQRVDRGTLRPRTSGATRGRCRAGVPARQRQRIRAVGGTVHPGPHPGAAGCRADRRRRPARELRIRRRRPACAVRRRQEERPGPEGQGSAARESSPTPPRCTCAVERRAYESRRSGRFVVVDSAACWPARTPP